MDPLGEGLADHRAPLPIHGHHPDTSRPGRDLLQEEVGDLGGRHRRHRVFGVELDGAQAVRRRLDLDRLVSYLERVPAGTEVKFVGFTDSVGAFEANRNLSFGRADAVLDEVRAAAGGRLDHVQFATTGYGEVAPSACNVTDRGKAINRRVEVWISKGSAT